MDWDRKEGKDRGRLRVRVRRGGGRKEKREKQEDARRENTVRRAR